MINTLGNTSIKGNYASWKFFKGKAIANEQKKILQLVFDEPLKIELISKLKKLGFKWSLRSMSWQMKLTDEAYRICDTVSEIKPLTNKKPTELLQIYRQEQVEQGKKSLNSMLRDNISRSKCSSNNSKNKKIDEIIR